MQNYESDSDEELPVGWQETVSNDGDIFYEDTFKNIRQKTHPCTGRMKKLPKNIPPGWKQVDRDGKTIYLNEETGFETQLDPRIVYAKDINLKHEFIQKFDSYSTALQVLSSHNLTNKVAIITGASAGIGLETAYSLMKQNCYVIFACRNLQKAAKAIEKLSENRYFNKNLHKIIHLDLADLKTVKSFSETIKKNFQTIDYLILNAAVFGLSYSNTIDGFETIFQVCHLAHFYLTILLNDVLKNGSRVIVVSSEAHRFSSIFNENITIEQLSPSSDNYYYHIIAYNNAKLLNILFANELSRKWINKGVTVFSVHPGNFVYSEFTNNLWFCKMLFILFRPFTKSLQQAAATTVFAATVDNAYLLNGSYFNNCCLCSKSKVAQNEKLARRVWMLSEQMIRDGISKH